MHCVSLFEETHFLWEMTSRLSPYSALSLVRLWTVPHISLWSFVEAHFLLGDDFLFVSVFSAMFGSTANTCTASVYGVFGRVQRHAWFDSGYKFMRQTTEAGFC